MKPPAQKGESMKKSGFKTSVTFTFPSSYTGGALT